MSLVGNVQLVTGDAALTPRIFALLEQEGIQAQGNPDVYVREYASFGVEEARELAAKASTRAIASLRRIFVVVTPSMTGEAQNALLKTLEEPVGDALFFIVIPSPHMLLPTLRSRAQLLDVGSAKQPLLVHPQELLEAKPQQRLDMLKPLLDKDEDDKRDLGSSIAFLAALERALSSDPAKNARSLRAVYRARRYIGDKGSLTKALLEQAALLM